MTDWIVAYCHANAENKAEINLRRQGFEVYFPKYKKVRRHARRIDTVIRPLFPRYLFVEFEKVLTLWRSIRSTVGVVNVLSAGERPLMAPSWVVEKLREGEDSQGFISNFGQKAFGKGDRIKILDGPFADHLAIFDGLDESQRVHVFLQILGRDVRATIPREAITCYG
tara:strand:+ start:390 stop:893 length:504 start_codon:yes stop_codon:yes gene_type:complete